MAFKARKPGVPKDKGRDRRQAFSHGRGYGGKPSPRSDAPGATEFQPKFKPGFQSGFQSGSENRPAAPWNRPAASPPPSKAELGKLMARYGAPLRPATLDLLWAYHQLLRKHNHDQDLTRLIGFDTIAQRHYADCMILHGLMGGKWPSPLVDVGSGAGFPGIMIKLMSPGTKIVLAEPRPRRVEFLEMVIKELRLRDISVFGHKVTSRSFTEPCAGAITRAFETVEKTLPRLGGCLPVGGKAIFMKGPKVAEELTDLRAEEYQVLRKQAYKIPNTSLDRVLLILERVKINPPKPSTTRDRDATADKADGDSEIA